jgi:hypothetical protein
MMNQEHRENESQNAYENWWEWGKVCRGEAYLPTTTSTWLHAKLYSMEIIMFNFINLYWPCDALL